jgi:hypothetical protein
LIIFVLVRFVGCHYVDEELLDVPVEGGVEVHVEIEIEESAVDSSV